jgi:hypothetical protein
MADLAGRADLRGLPERPVGAHAVAPFDSDSSTREHDRVPGFAEQSAACSKQYSR